MNEDTNRVNAARSSSDRVRTFVLAGVLAAGALYGHLLTSVHRQIAAGDRAGWACGGGTWFDCSSNLTSRYSTIFGIPASGYASAWFALMLTLLLGGLMRGEQTRALHRRLLIASAPAVAVTIFYALLSVLVLKSVCLYCAGVYLLVALVVFLVAAGAGIDCHRARCLLATGIYWAVPAIAFAAVVAFERAYMRPDAAPPTQVGLAALQTLPRLGPRHAALRIIVFSDFDCPACRLAAKELDRFLTRHPDGVEVRLVSIPVHSIRALASGDELPLSGYLSSAIGVVMQNRGRFWEYYRDVFLSDQAVDERFLWQVTARILGPNEIHAVRRDVEKPEVLATLRRHAAIARSYNISSTPGWIINGKVSTGAMKISELEERLGFARQSSGGRAVSPGGNGTTTQNAEHNPSELWKGLNATLSDTASHKQQASLTHSIQPEHHAASVEYKTNQLGEAAMAWAAYDVEAAVAWVRGLPDSAEKTDALVRLSSQWAEIDPRGAAAYAQIQDNLPMIAKVAAKWAESDPETAGAWAAQLPMGRARQHALASLIATWAEQSPLDAVKYVDSLPPSDAAQQQARISILARWANSDPDLVAGWMEALRGTVLADNVLGKVIIPWSQYNPAEVAGWLSTMPAGRARDDAVNAFAGVIEGQEPETAFHWTASIGDDSVRNIRMESAARAWLQKDRSSARPAILGSTLSAESKQRLLGAPNG